MSADNWGICPKCVKRHNEGLFNAQKAVVDNYGAVPLEDFIELQKKAIERKVGGTKYEVHELREDYEFWLDTDGTFNAVYKARCYNNECDFAFEFRHDEQVPL